MAFNCRANRGSLNTMYSGIIYQYKLGEKYYVGKTLGLERKRINKHKHDAFTKRSNGPFQRAIRKYGWDVALAGYSVIETVQSETKEDLNKILHEREAFWIRERNSLVPNGYNVQRSGQISIPTIKRKEDIYKKVSDALKGKYLNCPQTSRPVFCVEQNTWYPSISEAERSNGFSKGAVEKAASGKNCKAGGLTWSFDGTVPTRVDKIKVSRKPIMCIETKEVFDSVYDAARHLWGADASKKKCRIQASLKNGWAVEGKHFGYIVHDNPVLSETEV